MRFDDLKKHKWVELRRTDKSGRVYNRSLWFVLYAGSEVVSLGLVRLATQEMADVDRIDTRNAEHVVRGALGLKLLYPAKAPPPVVIKRLRESQALHLAEHGHYVL